MIVHPLLLNRVNVKSKLHRAHIAQSTMGDFWSDINPFDDIGNFVTGLSEAIGNVIETIVVTIGNVIQIIADIVSGIFKLIPWDKLFENLAYIARAVSNIAVQLNPLRLAYNFLSENPLTKHTFQELDKFTGGMITSAVNVSDLAARAMRGDAISKEELLRDALFCLQVAAVVVGGPAAAGGLVGNMVGKEVCKNAGEAKEACKIAVTIASVAAADYASSMLSTGSASITTSLSTSAVKVLDQRLVQEASKQAIRICQEQNWAGDRECAIMAQVAANYINAPEGTDWPTFLANEVARIGVAALMEEWFPKGSPERNAIRVRIEQEVIPVPGQTIVYETKPKANAGLVLLLAGGAALLVAGAV